MQARGLLVCNLDLGRFGWLDFIPSDACDLRCHPLKNNDRQWVSLQGQQEDWEVACRCLKSGTISNQCLLTVPVPSLPCWVGELEASCLQVRIYSEWYTQGLKLLVSVKFLPLPTFTLEIQNFCRDHVFPGCGKPGGWRRLFPGGSAFEYSTCVLPCLWPFLWEAVANFYCA